MLLFNITLFISSSAYLNLEDGNPIFMGITASVPKTSKKGVSPVDVFSTVRYD